MTASGEEYFDSLGARWDELRKGFFSDRVRDAALAAARVEQGRRAADLGAGTGFITRALLERGIHVIAVDRSPVMLAALADKFSGCERVETRVGSAEQLPITDASLDYCFANMFLHHVDSPAQAIAEMARVLKPGGRAVVTDLDAHTHAFLREEHHDRWMGFERDAVRGWFRDAGFEDVRVEGLGEFCCATSEDGREAVVAIFLASGALARLP